MINSTNFTPSITANNGLTNSFAPVKKKYVNIDGQQYDVKKVSAPLVSDEKKQVVAIDGQQYDIENKNGINLKGSFTFNPNARINPDSTRSYMA